MKKIISIVLSLTLLFFVTAPQTFAHVVVKPAEVGVGVRQNFVMSVPTEEETPTTQLRLIIPEGLKSVRPNVKPGWTIQLIKSGEGENIRISEIIWSGGSIPAEQRDEFIFSAQVPAEATAINWKAYQTYADGQVVVWDNDPKTVEEYTKNIPPKEGEHDENAPKSFSVTKVVNDLAGSSNTSVKQQTGDWSLKLSILAVALSGIALGIALRKKN